MIAILTMPSRAIMRLRSGVRRFKALDWRQRQLLAQAVLSLTLIAVLVHLLPFHRLAAWLRLLPAETPLTVDGEDERLAAQIGWAIGAAANRSPWVTRCLVRALAATLVGRCYGLQTTLYFGVARAEDGELKAHAWSRCGSCVITGRTEPQSFAVIACFSCAGG